MFKNLIKFAIIIAVSFSSAQADKEFERFTQIMLITMRADGYLTKQMHEEFWTLANKHNVKSVTEDFKKNNVFLQKYYYETYKSAYLSLMAEKVIKTEGFNMAHEYIETKQDDAFFQGIKKGLNKTNVFLKKVANKEPIKRQDIGEMVLDKTTILFTLSNIEKITIRLNKLMTPQWNDKNDEATDYDAIFYFNSTMPSKINDILEIMLITPDVENNKKLTSHYYHFLFDKSKFDLIVLQKDVYKNCKAIINDKELDEPFWKYIYYDLNFNLTANIYINHNICKLLELKDKNNKNGFENFISNMTSDDFLNLHFSKEILGSEFYKIYSKRFGDISIYRK